MIRRRFTRLSVLVFAAGCSSGTEPSVTLWEATLRAVAPGTVSGVVGAVAQGGRTRLTVEVRGAAAGQPHGWRMSEGTCAAEGKLIGGVALYPVLEPDPARTARADAAVPGQLRPGRAYAVRVFRPGAAGSEQIVACGDLVQTS